MAAEGANKEMENNKIPKLETSLNELVAAAGKLAFEYSENSQEAYIWPASHSWSLSRNPRIRSIQTATFAIPPSPSDRLH